MKIGNGQFWLGDCLELMADIPDGSVDMILCDLPYGTTACKWDTVIPFEPLWEHYWRVAKPNAAIVLTASQPFTTALIGSQIKRFKYCWVWEKNRSTGHVHAKNKPMKRHEDICVFSNGVTVHATQSEKRMPYNPQGLVRVEGKTRKRNDAGDDTTMSARNSHKETVIEFENYPDDILKFPIEMNSDRHHPTQKPVALFEYLIKTYTDPGETVLDNCAGSGTTAIAAKRTNRKWICIEKDMEYYEKACERVKDEIHRLL